MLSTLRIKNLALVAELTLELRPGYNVITGETGAGKSILIGALNLVLGERADRTLIRGGCGTCSVEAVFDVSKLRSQLKSFLDESGIEPCEEDQLVIKRTFTSHGANRQFINGSPTTLGVLTTIGEWLVDIHGPHDHQSLLHPVKQLGILDAHGGLEMDREAFAELVRHRAELEARKFALVVDERTHHQQLDLLRFQFDEITTAGLRNGEDEEVEIKYQRMSNAAKLAQLSQITRDSLSENENSVLAQAGVVGRVLQELQRVDSSASNLVELHAQAVGTLRELQVEVAKYGEKLDVNPGQLAELEERLNLMNSLKRKYGSTIAEVIAFGEEAKRKLHILEARETDLDQLNADMAKLDKEISCRGQELSAKRRKVIPQLSRAVSKQLADLGFSQSRFNVMLSSNERRGTTQGPLAESSQPCSQTGFDSVEFQFAPNPGEPSRPLRAIASSGEMARVMLAIKTVLAAEDDVPVLIFDEVDANVGGETANVVGAKMRQIAAKRQVLCITHLPQVAAPASTHFVVTKRLAAERTVTEVCLLGREDRVAELSRMLGGQSTAARTHAEALLK